MIENNGKEYYPLDFGKMVKDDKVYYDRSTRQKSYFYLAFFDTDGYRNFIPSGSTGLITADGYVFRSAEQH